jgi:hypothetical protein
MWEIGTVFEKKKHVVCRRVLVGILQYLRSAWVGGYLVSRYTSKFVIASISSSILNHSRMVLLRSRSFPRRSCRRSLPLLQTTFCFFVFVKGFLLECHDTKMVFEVPWWNVAHRCPTV